MRISVLIISVLLTQTSASFFGEWTSSLSSVKSSIGKFISDAAVDLKDTFDCTVLAVRQALSGNTTLPGYQKCQSDQNISPLSPSKPIQIYITPLEAPTPTDTSRSSQPEKKEVDLKATPNSTDNNPRAKNDFEKKIESDLLGETRILVNISSKLEREFKDLSKHVNEDLTKIENEQKQLSMERVMRQIDKLVEEEINYKNSTDSEIHEVFDKIITKLDNNNTAKFDLKEKIKSALAELEHNKNQTNVEHELKIWKEEELKNLNDIKHLLEKQEHNNTIKPDATSTIVINKPLHDMKTTESAKTARTAKRTKSVTSKVTVPSTETVPPKIATPNTPVVRKSSKKRAKTKKVKTTKPPSDYDSLVSKDKSTLGLAQELVSNSKQTEAIMASILKNEKSASSVFDRPELFVR